MAKVNPNPSPNPSGNPSANPNPAPPPPAPPTGFGSGPTGNSGFSMTDSTMSGLQGKAGDLQSRLSSISSGLRGLNFSGNALGPIGLFAVPALNSSNDNAVAQAERGAKAFGDVQAGLKATQNTSITSDSNNAGSFKQIDPTTNVKPPPNSVNMPTPAPRPDGPKVSSGPNINGGPSTVNSGTNTPGGPKVSSAPNINGGPSTVNSGANTPGGPTVSKGPDIKGGSGPIAGGPKPASGPSVSAAPNIKGGGAFNPSGVNTPGGPAVSAGPNVKGGAGGFNPAVNTPGGPAVSAGPNVKGGPVGGAPGRGPVPGGGPVAVPPPVGGQNPASTKGAPPAGGKGGPVSVPPPGGKGVAPGVTPGVAPAGKGVGPGLTPGAAPGVAPGVTPPGAKSAAGVGAAPGVAPGVAPGATPPGASSADRSSKFTGPGAGKGVFDAPKAPVGDGTISKAPKGDAAAPPVAPKPGATPGTSVPKPGGAVPNVAPGTSVPSTQPGVAPAAKPGTSVPTPSASSTVAPNAQPGAAPMAPGAAPGAPSADRSSKFTGPGAGKGVFDAPKPPVSDGTISKAPKADASAPPVAPKPNVSAPSTSVPSTQPGVAPAAKPGSPPPSTAVPNAQPNVQPGVAPAAKPAPAPNAGATPNVQPNAQPSVAPAAKPAPNTGVAPNPQPAPALNPQPGAAPKPGTPVQNTPAPASNPAVAGPNPAVQTPAAPNTSAPNTSAPKPNTSTNSAPDAQPILAPIPHQQAPQPPNAPKKPKSTTPVDSDSPDTSDYDADDDVDQPMDPFDENGNLSPEFRDLLKTRPDSAWFWSGRYIDQISPPNADGTLPGASVMKPAEDAAFAENGGSTLEAKLDGWSVQTPTWDPNDPKAVSFWKDSSKFFAEGASGVVHAALGEQRRQNTVFETIELPALKQNPNVTEVIQVDPISGQQKTIYTKEGVTPSFPDVTPPVQNIDVPAVDDGYESSDHGYDADSDSDIDDANPPKPAAPKNVPSPERSFDGPPSPRDLDSLVNDLTDANAKRNDLGYLPPVVEVSGPNAQSVVDTLANNGIDAKITDTRPGKTDVHVDWDLKRPEGYVPPAAPVSEKVTDTVITSDKPQGPHPILGDESWRHSKAPTADWARPNNPASNQEIQNVRQNTPITGFVRGEDGGVLTNSKVAPGNVDLKAWRGPIAYDKRTFDVNGKGVQDYTVKLHLDGNPNDIKGIQERAQQGVDSLFNQGHRLPSGDQLHVTVEFTDNPADAHSTIKVTGPDGRANQLNWPSDTDPRRLAHEVGHFLGLQDEYFETDKVKPVFQHQDGKGRVVNDNAPMTDGIDAPNAEIKPRNLWLIENRANALASPNPAPAVDIDSDVVVPPPPRSPQQSMLDVQGVEAVDVPGADPKSSMINAVAATLHPTSPDARQALVDQLNGANPPSLDAIAKAADAKIYVLDANGRFGPPIGSPTGRPVHVVETKSPDGDVRYQGTKENVHIGRPGVSYPGPTKVTVDGQPKTVHRGEFEIETIGGRHHVRLYTAVVNPADLGVAKPPFKDIQQDPKTGELKISPGNNAQLWAGAGRPQRAVQWLQKYEETDGGQLFDPKDPSSVKRPVLRSFLVPLDTFNKITSGSTVEGAPNANSATDTYNVDQRGEPNQFGIGGPHLDELIKNAEPGSLISYPSNPNESFAFPDQAGRVVPATELYDRLGIDPDFKSDALGKAYDPWFSWEMKNGEWKAGFRNDAQGLHDIATQLREHHLTWEQSKQDPSNRTADALITPDAESIPNAKEGAPPPKDTSYDARVQRLNQFLNEVGPAAGNVGKVTNDVLSTGAPALDSYLSNVATPAVDQAAFEQALRENVVPDAARHATKTIDSAVKGMKSGVNTRQDLQDLIDKGFRGKGGKALKTFDAEVVTPTVDDFKAQVENHPDLALLDQDSRSKVAEALGNQMRDALNAEFGKIADLDGLQKGGKKGSWLSGPRLGRFGDNVAADMKAQPLPNTPVAIDKDKITEVARNEVLGKVAKGALDSFTGKDLANTKPDELRAVVSNEVLPRLETDLSSALKTDPALALADQNFRNNMADAVAFDARMRAEHELAGFQFDPVDPAAVDALMAKVPGIATQAEIGALMAADSDRMAVDFNTRHDTDTRGPFPNDFHEWKTQRPAELANQQRAGADLDTSINSGTHDPKAVVDQLIREFPELNRKFDEVATQVQKTPERAPGAKGVYTFYEHAQMVLGQFQNLTANENPEARLIPKEALAKAILFHDIEKVNAKNQFGDGQGKHDAEPEHKLAVEMMDRYRGLWKNDTEFQAARAIVDSDPFGFYLRNKIDADETFKFINDLANKIDPQGKPESAQKLFNEFHQYYQADFSSYTTHSTYVDRDGNPQVGPNSFTNRFDAGPDGITKTPDGRHFEYTKDSDAARKIDALADMFRDPDTIRANQDRLGVEPPAPAPETSPNTADTSTDTSSEPMLPNAPRPRDIPLQTMGPNAVLPTQQLPSFVQNSQALGTIAPTNPSGGPDVANAVTTMLPTRPGVTPTGIGDIQTALDNNFESFLGSGRNFPVKVGNQWFEANVKATMRPTDAAPVAPEIKTKVDLTTNSGANTGTSNTIGTSGSVGGGAVISTAVGPYGSVSASAQLARPVQSTSTGTSIADQRAIRSGSGEKTAVVPVDYQVTLLDANMNVLSQQNVDGDVTLHIPDDIGDMTPNPDVQTVNLANDVGPKMEFVAPEAVVDFDSNTAFDNIAAQLHPSITKLGAQGRTDLQNFLDPTTIRDNLGAALNGWVVSPDLVSPHGSRGGVVRMTATPVSAQLVGTNNSTVLRLHESVATSSGVSSSSKSGFDVNVGVGGGATVAGQVGGTAGVVGGVSSKTSVTANAGTSSSVKTGMQVKGDTGVYQVRMNLDFETPHGTVSVPVTTHMRMGLPEANNVGLPTPDNTPAIATPTADKRYLPPYLASAAASGHVKVGELTAANQVQTQVETALKAKFGDLLPNFNSGSNPNAIGKNMADLAEMMNNQRKLNTELSPLALKSQMDSLLGPGVQVQLKKQGLATNEYVNVTVKARFTNPQHVGQADNRFVRNATSTGPKLDSAANVQKGWNLGVEGRVAIPSTTGNTSATPTPSFGGKYNSSTNTKTGAGPTVGSTSLNVGSPNAQLFTGDIEFDVEITSFERNRSWVKRLTPGSPFRQVPAPAKIANLPKINGRANLWVSDSAAMKADPAQFTPSVPPKPTKIDNPPTIGDLLTSQKQNPSKIDTAPWLHVEAVANAQAVRDAAIEALNTAAKGDSSLTVPGTEARNRIDKMLSPESLRANLRTLVDQGMTEGGMKYDRRVYDRSGALGMSVGLSQPRVVSISDNVGTENANTGGFKAGDSKSGAQSVDLNVGLNTPMKPATAAKGSGAVGANAKWTPWSKSSTDATEVGGSVDRNKVTPSDGRTVLLQVDATFTLVGESREANTVHKGTPNTAGVTVDLPGGVFVRVSEDVARDMGLLDDVPSHTKPDFGTMQPPSTLKPGEPGSVGLGLIEKAPNLTNLVPQLRTQLGQLGTDLLPPSVLDDSMNNLRRLTDLTSDASVKALMDSALDGGVPLLVHNPGVFGKDSYQVTLKATPGTPTFDGAVNDGVEIEHTISGTGKVSEGSGKGTGWGVNVRVPGAALPGSANPNISGNVGGFASAGFNQAHSTSTTNSTTNQVNHYRAGTGPAVKYNVPVTFELVVEKGDQEIRRVRADEQMTVRLHADNQSINPVASPAFNPTPTPRPAAQGAPNAASNWQQNGPHATLPPSASVESFRGAKAVQDAAVQALKNAGANAGITGKGTGSLNALQSGLSSESLQPNLPGMLDGAFEVPGLHESALTISQHANVKVYAKMVNPRLAGLSDGVRLENPRTTVNSTSSEVKHSETADVAIGAASGGVSSKDPNVGFSTGGAEFKHGGEDSSANSGGAQNNPVRNLKPDGRTGLVQYDVEYRVVADLGGGKVGVVDLTVPDSAQVRMTAPDAQTALGKQFGNQLGDAQTSVKDAAAAWRTAEVAADQAQHAAEPVVNQLTGDLRGVNDAVYARQNDVQTAENTLADARKAVAGLETQLDQAQRTAADLQSTVDERAQDVTNRETQSNMAQQLLLGANLDLQSAEGAQVQPARDAQQAAQALANRTDEALRNARDLHNDAVNQLGVAQGNVTTANQNLTNAQQRVAQAEAGLDQARQRLDDVRQDRQNIQNQIDTALAPVEQARTQADTAQQNWWNAKQTVDQEVARFNTPPAPGPNQQGPGTPTPQNPATPGSSSRSADPVPPSAPSPTNDTAGTSAPSTSAPTAAHTGPASTDPVVADIGSVIGEVESEYRHHAQETVRMYTHLYDRAGWAEAQVAAGRPPAEVAAELTTELQGIGVNGMIGGLPDTAPEVGTFLRQGWTGVKDLWADLSNSPADRAEYVKSRLNNDKPPYVRRLQTTSQTVVGRLPVESILGDFFYAERNSSMVGLPDTSTLTANEQFAVLADHHAGNPGGLTEAMKDPFQLLLGKLAEKFAANTPPDGQSVQAFQHWLGGHHDAITQSFPENAQPAVNTLLSDGTVEFFAEYIMAMDDDPNFTPPQAPAHDATPRPAAAPAEVAPRADRGPKPERSFTGTPTEVELAPLINDLAEARATRDQRGYLPPVVEVSGANAQAVADALAGHGITAKVTEGRADGVDVHVDWDLKRPEGHVPPAAPQSVRVTDTVITSPAPQPPSVLDDLSWKHSTAASADWFDARNPVSSQDIANARRNAPISSTVRGEDGGVLSNSSITPDGVNLKAWRGPIAYDVRTLDVNGAPVKDLTVKVFLDGKPGDIQGVQDRTRAGVEEMFNRGNRLPGGEQFHVTVEFTSDPADAHGAIKITEPGGRANQLNWPSDTDARRLAHEVGHFLGLHDEYFETNAVKPIFQHQDGKGRVVNDNAPMTDGIDEANASLKPRNLWLIENRMKALESFNVAPAPVPVDPNTVPPNTFLNDVEIPTVSDSFAADVQNAVDAPKIDVEVPKVADTFVEELFDDLDANVDTAPRPPRLLEGEWSSPQPVTGPLTPQRLQDEFGMPQVNQQRFQNLADRLNLVYDVRPTNPDSVRWLEEGAVPKPKDIKAKTISSLDVFLGASPETIGLVGYFEPKQPDYDSLDPDVRERVRQRYENRKREFGELKDEFASLEQQGRYRIENGIVQANTPNGFKHITGDHDVYHIRRPDDGSALEVDDYDLDVWLLTKRNIGVQHGAHMYWDPQGAFQEKIFNDIVSRHQQTAPDAEPLIRFSPGQPPSLVFADPPPVHTESDVAAGLRRDGGPEGVVLADLGLPHLNELMTHAQTFVDRFAVNPAVATPAQVAHVASELHHNGAVAAETAAREIGDVPARHTALVNGLGASPAGQAVLSLNLPPVDLQDLMVHAATIAQQHSGVDPAQIALTLHNSGPVTARAVADALSTPSGEFDADAELPNAPTRRTAADQVITFNPETGFAEVMDEDVDGADRDSMVSFLDDMGGYPDSLIDGYTGPVTTVDYDFASDGVEPQFVVHGTDVQLQSRPGQFPSVLPVVQTGVAAKPPMMFSADSTIGLPLGDSTARFKEFYATPQVIADAQARLKEVGSKLELKVAPGNTVTHGDTTLLMVTPHFKSTPPGVCSEFSQGIVGGSHTQAIMRPPVGTPTVGKIANGGPLVFNGTHEMAYVLAQFASNPLATGTISPQAVSNAMAGAKIDPPPVGAQYGAALVPGTDARAKLDQAAEQLGLNQFAWAKPGEAYVIQSIAAPDATGANYGLNYARTGTGQQLPQVWGYHFGSVAVNSAADDMQITVETVRQGGYRKYLLDQTINENLRNHGHNLPAIKAWLESQPVKPEAELVFVDALAVIQDSRAQLADPAVVGGDRQAAETALKRAEFDARSAINKIAGPQLPQPGQMWFFGEYSKKAGDSFFDKWGHVDDPSAQMQVANPLVAVATSHQIAANFQTAMEDAKNLEPARVATGEQKLPGIANSQLTGLAKTTVEAALWRHRNGMPLPEIRLHGYGNDRLHGTRTGRQRADAAAAWTRSEVARLLDELQRDVPPAYRLGADQIRILPISHGRDVPPGSTNPEADRHNVYAEMVTPA